MNVLMVAPKFSPYMGGIETHVYEVGKRLAHSGVDITVLTTDRTWELPAHEIIAGMAVRRVPAWLPQTDWHLAPAVYPFICKGKWDLIHIQGIHSGVPPFAMLAAVRAGIPFVITFHHGGHSSDFRNSIRSLQWSALLTLMRRASHFIGVSQFEIDFFQARLNVPAERFTLIPNGGALPQPMHVADKLCECKLIVSAGRLEKYKGHHRVIAAMPELIKRDANVRLRIAGTGPYEPALRRQAHQLGIADRVEIKAVDTADRAGMAELLMQADLVTLLSDCESHPISVMEAIALKRSALVADNSGMRELAQKGYARAVSLDLSPAQLASAMLDQIQHPLVPPNIDIPTWDQCAQGVLKVYCNVLSERSSPCAS